MLILHSKMYVENICSVKNSIKTSARNLQAIESVSDLLRVKSYDLSSTKISDDENEKDLGKAILFEP